ncbi:G patch domain-containing protein 11 [Phlebotomus argentipes]|uniref:G patch domain-containing protein 11 n=1 Tax=Phlebotomus argentipes TaxID=94469 RepID=UPI002892F995|nr:G patch domain-containing protein 11 [Phlebotomus argentipes]XP_059618276.1 G patch domain-containing protein 11 [Phlebotomus argentipes]XP_059618284.1 G patch domain-containing protein 11 [Phlebotomus argentipes]
MSSDEEDYMSDKFLAQNVPNIRPGLIKNRERQREVEVQAKKMKFDEEERNKYKPSHVKERERLEEGLSSALTTENKGFALLAKMGYKQGDSIGKSGSQGIVEPIGITLKTGRGGLGRDAALKQLEEKKQAILKQRLLERAGTGTVSAEEFRNRMFRKAENQQIESDLGKCQRTCERLDASLGTEEPEMEWFWPPKPKESKEDTEETEEEDDEEEEEDFEPAEKLDMLSNYLRSMHLFCHWCGVKYNDMDDLLANCPGATKDDH